MPTVNEKRDKSPLVLGRALNYLPKGKLLLFGV